MILMALEYPLYLSQSTNSPWETAEEYDAGQILDLLRKIKAFWWVSAF